LFKELNPTNKGRDKYIRNYTKKVKGVFLDETRHGKFLLDFFNWIYT